MQRRPNPGFDDGVSPSVQDLTHSEMKVAFQPIVDVATGRTFAVEALARCQRPGLESPLVLFNRATDEQAQGRLGRLIRQVAFTACADLPLFVNVHPDELNEHWLIQPDDPLGFHEKPVFLEITEGAAFTHFDLCSKVLMELCARTGAYLVVDDFGAGYSNIQRILDLEPAVVKLDLALIRKIDEKPRQQAVVRHMVALCADLGCKVVAEGIETLDELLTIRDLGVHYAQGYFLARPAFSPPDVAWPAGLGGRRRSKQPAGPPPSRRMPTLPAPSRPRGPAARVLVEEVVLVSAARPPVRQLPQTPPARPVRASKLPTVRPKRQSSRAPEPTTSRRPPAKRKTKAPPR